MSGKTWLFMAVLKISTTLLKYPIFDGWVFYVFMGKKGTRLEFLHIVLSAIIIMSGKKFFSALKCIILALKYIYVLVLVKIG
jgi:hypothetical protein